MSDRAIRDAINQMTGNHLADKVYVMDGLVSSVDESSRTCVIQVISGRAQNEIHDVRLMSSVDDGILIIPEVGSNVCVIISDYTAPYVSQYSGVEKIVLRGGDKGGIIEIVEFTAKINLMISKINAELVKISAGIVTAGGAYAVASLPTFNKSDYENTAVKHG